MNIMNRLSLKGLRLNRKRTVSTIIGIILSTALVCAVGTLAASVQATLVENAVNESGYFHLKIGGVTPVEAENLENNRDIRDMFTVWNVGYALLPGSQNEDKPYVHLLSMDETAFERLPLHLTEGRLPENENELLISRHIESNGQVTLQVGDSITFQVGERVTGDGWPLHPTNLYSGEDELLRDTVPRSFRIVGVIERLSYDIERYTDPGYSVITTGLNRGSTDVYLSLKNPKKFKTSIPMLLGVEDYRQLANGDSSAFLYDDWEVNRELLRWEVFAFSDSTVSMLYAVVGVVLSIILITSVFCIRNSFAIAATEKMKMYGMLSSVGATGRQIRRSVIFEGMALGCIGIPLGIASGFFAVFVLLKIVNALLGDYLLAYVDGITYKISLFPVVLSVLLGLVTIYLSAVSSAKKAARVSPLEQLRNSGAISVREGRLSVPRLVRGLFGMGGVLAYKSLKRSRRRYRTTVVSIAVSIFVFISMNAFITEAFDLTSNYYQEYDYNVRILPEDDLSQPEMDSLLSLKGIEESFLIYRSISDIIIRDKDRVRETEDVPLESDFELMADENGEIELVSKEGEISPLAPVALDRESFRKYCEKVGVDYESARDGGILFDTFLYDKEGHQRKVRRYSYEKGDIISGSYFVYGVAAGEGHDVGEYDVEIRVAAVSAEPPYGMERDFYRTGGYLVLEEGRSHGIPLYLSSILLRAENSKRLTESLKKLQPDLYVQDLEESVRADRAMVLVAKIFLYGFIAVITLIGVTNIFNTISSNMELRQKEFAMLKSVGMTRAEFRRMINLETLFLGSKSLFYGIGAGIIGTFTIYRAFAVKIDRGLYLPLRPILLSVIFVFLLIFVIMRYSMGKINRQNTIETIRRDNI